MANPFPQPQGITSRTFTPPPIDGSLSIPEIYDYHYEHNGNHPLFVYDDNGGAQTVYWRDALNAVYNASRTILKAVPRSVATEKNRPVIGILAVADQLSYFAVSAGVMRAGYRSFPISPRNSDAAVANLLEKMDVHYLIVSGDKSMQDIATAALARMENEEHDIRPVEILPMPSFQDLYGNNIGKGPAGLPSVTGTNVKETALILHSSGSTSFPKPITLTHSHLLQWGTQPYYGETDICGLILSNHSLPFFHAMGVVSLCWATMSGLTLSNFKPQDPPIIPTPDRIFESATTVNSNMIFCVPSFLEEWSQSEEMLEKLKKFHAIMFGGAPLQQSVGDMLYQQGAKLYPFYGATELGGSSKFLPANPPPDGWEYFEISGHTSPEFQYQDEDIYRLLFKGASTHSPAVLNYELFGGTKAYDTNDLLIRHPLNHKLWKIYGRSDDQIMHSTGEKTNPVPLETIMNRHPLISNTLMFGRGRFQAGVLVEPIPNSPVDINDVAAYRNAIWSAVEEANDFAPSHSRIFKELILIASPSKPFQYTPKGTPRRHVILGRYETEINDLYAVVEESSQGEIPLPENFGETETLDLVRAIVSKVMLNTVKDTDDIFQNGCDSLQATWIRNTVLNVLRKSTKIATKNIPVNFVYTNPTIRELANYLYGLVNNTGGHADQIGATIKKMNEFASKYSQRFFQHIPGSARSDGEVVLLTGSTGGLGSYILEVLLQDPHITKVFALNRKGRNGKTIVERQKEAFQDRGVDTELLRSHKLVFLEGDAGSDGLGLPFDVYQEVRQTITSIFHIAWRVDFNVAISSMEPFVAGTRRLVDLALSSPQASPPRIIFASSIGVLRNWKDGFVPETALTDPAIAIGSGYPESKWVAEQVLDAAAKETTLSPVIVRIGQISGGRNGSWNADEWVPSIVQSAQYINCLPNADGVISWVPAHIAAAALVEMRRSRHRFLHLVHPNPTSWNKIFNIISKLTQAPTMPYFIWLRTLEASASSDKPATGALRLLDYYQSANKPLASDDAEAFGFPRLSTLLAVETSASLQGLEQLGHKEVGTWLGYWQKIRVIPAIKPEAGKLQRASEVHTTTTPFHQLSLHG